MLALCSLFRAVQPETDCTTAAIPIAPIRPCKPAQACAYQGSNEVVMYCK